jgi:hypothetical protein
MQINKTVMFTQALSRDELYILRTQIWQLYRAQIYRTPRIPTTIADLVCTFNEDRDFLLELSYKDYVVFSFDPKTKIIKLDWEKFNELYSEQVRNRQSLGWSIGAIFDQIYQEQSGAAMYVFETMTNSKIRKMARDFHGLLEATGRLSAKRIYSMQKYSVAQRGDGWAVYDPEGMLIVATTARMMHFGVGYVTGTDLNENVENIIQKIRPHVLGMRTTLNNVRQDIAKLMKAVVKAKGDILKLGAGTLTQAARFDVDRFQKEHVFVSPSGSKVFFYDDQLVVEAARGGNTLGNMELLVGQQYPGISAKMMDTLRDQPELVKMIDVDLQKALVSYSHFITAQVTTFLEDHVLAKAGIEREQAKPHYEAFMKLKERGFRGDFEAFALIIKPLKD